MANTIKLTEDELIQLAEQFGVEVPDLPNKEAANALMKELFRYIEDVESCSAEEYIKKWKEGEKKMNDTTNNTTNTKTTETIVHTKTPNKEDLSQLTFKGLAEKAQAKLEADTERRAMKLVRVRITCNNTNKRNLKGEIFTVRNDIIPEVKKFVPFNKPTHIPQILYNVIKERKYQVFTEETLPNGRKKKKGELTQEYNIQELPPLTAKELDAIRRKQLLERAEEAE